MTRTRRTIAALCAVVAVSGLLAVTATGAGAAKKAKFDPNGILKSGFDMTAAGGLKLDPISMGANHYNPAYQVLWSLLVHNQDGSYSPGFAEKVDVPDPATIVVTLRKNLVFSNGETLDSTAAVNSIKRAQASLNNTLRIAEMALLGSATVDSPTQFTLKLTGPVAGRYYPLLSDAETAPVAPASQAANTKTSQTVIAAGPFKIDSFTTGSGVKMSKNEKFYGAKDVKLAGFEVVHIAPGPASYANALKSNAIDYVSGTFLPASDAAGLTAPYTVVPHELDAPHYSNICIQDGEPMANLKVRQALNYATDRDEINERLYAGKGHVAWSLYPGEHANGDPSLDNFYKYNLKKAKQLMTEAGYPNGFKMIEVTGASGESATIVQILQAQWAKIGVQLEIRPSANFQQDWVASKSGDSFTTFLIREGVSRVARFFTSDAFINSCGFKTPTVDALVAQLSALAPDDPDGAKIWKKIDTEVTKNLAFGVPLLFIIQNAAYNSDRVAGMAWRTDPILGWQPDTTKVYIKAGK